MLKEERRRFICDMVATRGRVSVAGLVRELATSEMTIRRDLQALEQQGLVDRIHGGALMSVQRREILEPPLLARMNTMVDEKQAIARTVSQMVKRDEKIFLTSGSTTYWIAKELATRNDITVFTNGLTIANVLAQYSTLDVIVIGGSLRRSELSLIGYFAETVIRSLRVDKVITGIQGIHPDYGLTSDHPEEVATDQAIMNISDTFIIAADSSKFGQVASIRSSPLRPGQIIVTTSSTPLDLVDAVRERGATVIQV